MVKNKLRSRSTTFREINSNLNNDLGTNMSKVRSSLPASYSIVLGKGLGLASSWPFCFCVNNNTCEINLPGRFSLPDNPQSARWSSQGYKKDWIINGINDTRTSGYLFLYFNNWLCGSNIGADQGPGQLVIVSSASQINALNNPNARIGDSLSKFILTYLKTSGKRQNELLPNLIFDEPIVYSPFYFAYPDSNSDKITNGVINITIETDNSYIDLAKYVVTITNAKITYEIQVIDDRMEVGVDVDIINGSTLFILLKKQTSLTLTVRQEETEVSITLNIIPS